MEKLTKKERKELRKLERAEEEKKKTHHQVTKKIFLWGSVAALVIGSILILNKASDTSPNPSPKNTPSPTKNPINNIPAVSETDITKGSDNPKITLIEYSDFQCPSCQYYYPIVKRLSNEYKDKVKFVYRFFPLNTHKNAIISSAASYAAHLQNKFWQMHDMLFENQDEWQDQKNPEDLFLKYAKQIGLNKDTFKQDLEAKTTGDFIDNEVLAVQGIVSSTPTFYLNGEKIENPKDYEAFKALIERYL